MTNGEKKSGKGKPIVFEFDSLDAVHDDIQEASPLPHEPAITAHGEDTAAKISAAEGLVDKKGVKFDPAIHAVNADGEPSVTPLGKFRRKRGTTKVASQAVQVADAHKKAQARAAGKLCADMMVGSAIMFLGPDWVPLGGKEVKPEEYDEREVLRGAFADYFEAKNFTDFPPGIALTMIVSSYMVPRFTAGKETKTRLKKFRTWIGEKWQNRKDKRKAKEDAAQSDTGNNGVGKDDTSEENGGSDKEQRTRSPRP